MRQANDIQQRFTDIEQSIDKAAEACQTDRSVPPQLKEAIQKLDQQSDRAKQQLQKTQDEASIRQCVDDLEKLSDEAKRACQQAGNVNEQVKIAVLQAHEELSNLKHQLH